MDAVWNLQDREGGGGSPGGRWEEGDEESSEVEIQSWR